MNIYNFSLLDDDEYKQIIYEWNRTEKEYPHDKTIVDLFEEQAAAKADNLAVKYEGTELSYAAFNEAVNRLGRYLAREYGLGPDSLAALYLDRSELMLLGIWSVLKAGGAYVPVLPDYPAERIGYVLRDTGAKVVLTAGKYVQKLKDALPGIDVRIEALDDDGFCEKLQKENGTNPERRAAPENLAYVIYTSGTTGEPKGAMLEHRGLLNRVYWMNCQYPLGETDRILQKTPYTFDVSVWELTWALLYGASIIFSKPEGHRDSEYLADLIGKERITVIHFVPSMLSVFEETVAGSKHLMQCCESLRYIFCSGEALALAQVREAHKLFPQAEIHNLYGPTEASIDVLYYDCTDKNIQEVLIGRPIYNTTMYILDEMMTPVPVGAIGELYIGGVGVARGYLNKPELTAEKFVPNPFQSEEEKARGYNGRLYRTGDLSRYRSGGNIEYLGRNDFQVKIRGNRIELGEIENAICGFDGIKQCAVIAREREGNKYLAAYYVGEIEVEKLRQYLEGKLPGYMAPEAYMRLTELPLSANGKLDRKALPEPYMQDTSEYEPPANETEKKLQKIFAEMLGLEGDKLSVTGDFFRLGGNSIMAIKLANRIQRQMNMEVKVADIFANKSVRNLAESAGKGQRERIEKAVFNRVEDQRLSFAQGRLWFIENYEGGGSAYNIPMTARLKKGVNSDSIKQAVREIIRRHEALRSVIQLDEKGEAYQKILETELYIEEKKCRSRIEAEQAIQHEARHIFKLSEEIPIRVTLFITGKDIFASIVIHHIAFDGWSQDIFLRELEMLYGYYESSGTTNSGAASSDEYPLAELEIQYKDYAVWQRRQLSGKVLESELQYWKEKLSGYETLNLITDKERPASQQYEGDKVTFNFYDQTSKKIKKIAKELGVSVYTVLLSGYYLLLSAYSGQKDIVVGTLSAGREREDTAAMIGFFVNTLAMRLELDAQKNVFEFIKELGEEIAQAQRHGEVPFDRVVEALGAGSDRSRHPIFQAAFLLQEEWAGCKSLFAQIGGEQEAAKFDLQLSIAEGETRIRGEMQYAVSLFEKETVECYANSYIQIVAALVEEKKRAIKEICLIGESDYKKIINEWNRTQREYPRDKTIVDLFEEQAAKTPENLAVKYDGSCLSYKEFNEAANRLGHYLAREYGTGADDLIAVCLDRSELMLIGIWGILKSGAAYVPIQPDYPAERISYILHDTGAKAVLTNVKYRQKIFDATGDNEINIEAIDEESFKEKLKNESAENPKRRCAPENLAYVIYTSGTTGEPKGAMLEHRGLMNRVYWMNSRYPLCETDRILQKTPYTFDVSVWELTWALLYGASIVFAKPDGHRDSEYLAELIGKERITVIHFVPSMLGVFEETAAGSGLLKKYCECLRYILCSGEALALTHVKESHKLFPQAQIHNLYGPTEASIDVLYYDCTDHEITEVLIGRPIYNTTMYILDEVMRPVPLGALGELYIGGVGLARGYLNKPELTAEKFVPNPFQSKAEKARGYNGRLYRTGDVTRYRADGNIEYFGRYDFQVKIRGNRIELGEIENAINGFDGIKQCAVLAKEREGNKFLAAYYAGEADTEALIQYLKERLPEYMAPAAYVKLDSLPMTANGKLDRKALPEPDMQDTNDYEPPANETETEMQKIFAQVLGLAQEKVSVTADFFRLGGDSIRSIQLANRIRRQLGLELTVKDIFAQKTVRNLTRRLQDSLTGTQETEQGVLSGTAPLLPVQKWFFKKADDGSFKKPGHFNQAFTIETPELDVELLRISVMKLTQWHDAFRLRYRKDKDGKIEQYYTEETSIPELKLADIDGKSSDEIEIILSAWQSGFDLYGNELCSIGYLSANGKGLIHIAMHHLIVDAVSWRILKDDLHKIYEYILNEKTEGSGGYEKIPAEQILGKKGTSYRQWAKIVEQLGQEATEKDREYWAEITAGIKKYQEKLRTLRAEKREQQELRFDIDTTGRLLRDIHERLGTEANDILLAAVMVALSEMTGVAEQYVTVEGHGRDGEESVDLSRTTGWFTTMYPLRVNVEADLQKTVIETKEALRCLRGKALLFGALCGYDGTLPPIVYNYLGQFESQLDTNSRNFVFSRSAVGKTVSDENDDGNVLVINGAVINGELVFTIEGWLSVQRLQIFTGTLRKTLEALAAQLGGKGRRYLTPSDTQWIVSPQQLEKLQAEREIAFVFPANSLQEGFIYHHLSAEADDDSYIVQNLWNYRCALEVNQMRKAWELALQRHPALRLHFDWESELVQVIDREAELDWRFYDISKDEDQDGYIERLRTADRQERYDLSKGKLFRVYIVKRNNILYTVIFSMHHAIGDGWSNPVLLKTVHEYYDRLVQTGQAPAICEDRSYPEAQEYVRERAIKTDSYWDQYLSKLEEENFNSLLKKEKRSVLLGEYRRIQDHAEETAEIRGEAYQSMLKCCADLGITVNTLIQYAWHKQLKVYGSGNVTVTGMTVSGRDIPVEGIEDSVGLYINTLPVIYEHDSSGKVTDELKTLQEIINNVTSRSWKRLGGLVKGDRRIFNSLFVYENYPVADGMSGSLKIEYVQAVEKLDYPLGVMIGDRDGSLAINIKYAGELFEREKIQALLEGIKHTIEQAANNIELTTNELKFISGDEYNRIINEWNKTRMEYPQDKTAVDLFEEQAAKTPDNIAVIYEGVNLSYRELNEMSNRLSRYLVKEYNIGADDIVALCLDRSELMLVSILGVLKAGGAYTPMGPDYPEDRLAYMIQDTGTKVILANEKYSEKLGRAAAGKRARVESVDGKALGEILRGGNGENPVRRSGPENLAYVMYTSGTTGRPKGVMIEHHGLTNQLHWMNSEYPLRETDRIFQKTTYTFDVSVWDLLWAIQHGAGIVFAAPEGHLDNEYLAGVIEREQVTVIQFVPSMLAVFEEAVSGAPSLAKQCKSLRYIFCIGEALSLSHVREGQRLFPQAQIHNLYGPTEATLAITYYPCHDQKINEVLIGRPMGNCTCYILDEQMRAVPEGAVGELHLGGVQLARGYLNRQELTAEKFTANPFQSEEEKARGYNGRLYKTGDLTRYLPDGNIEYLGRNDFQVKIRGMRIELGEIESAINVCEGVKQCAVAAKERCGAQYLAAYYIGEAEPESLKKYLEEKLPEYMVPGAFVRMTEFPMSANGKLDRKALPEPDIQDVDEYEPPANETETELQKIFAQVLGLAQEKVSVNGDFFRLGGDSILAIKLAGRLRQQLNITVSVKDIFIARTARLIAAKISDNNDGQEIFTEQGMLSGTAPMLPVQKWFFKKVADGSFSKPHYFNQAFMIETPELDTAVLRISVKKLTQWHGAFRLRYRKDKDGNIEQYYAEETSIPELKLADIDGKSGDEIEIILSAWQSGFDLYGNELCSIGYLSANGRGLIHIAMHHLIVDAVSWRILKDDLHKIYEYVLNKKTEGSGGYEKIPAEQILGKKGTSYRQWANRVARLGQNAGSAVPAEWEGIGKEIVKYREKLRKLDKGAREQQEARLNKNQTERLLRGIHEKLGTEANDVLLGAAMAALGALTGESANYVTLEGHGRDSVENEDLSRTVGWFTVMYPARVDAGSLVEMVIRAKEALRRLRGKELLYGALYGYEGSLPEIVYNYLGQFEAQTNEAAGADRWVFSRMGAGKTISNKNNDGNLLAINAGILGGELVFTVTGRLGGNILKHFAQTFRKNILELISTLGSGGRRYLTPSDVRWTVTRGQLDHIQKEKEIEAVFPANSLQEGFIYHQLREKNSDDSYIIQNVWDYHCEINALWLKESWRLAMEIHPALRLRFDWEGELAQVIDREGTLDWRYYDISKEDDQDGYAERLIAADRNERYDLSKGKLFRVYLVKRNDILYTSIFSMHHAIGDGWSSPALVKTVHTLYDIFARTGTRPVAHEDRSYLEAQEYLRMQANSGDMFWHNALGKLNEEEDLSLLLKEGKHTVHLGEYRRILESAEERIIINGDAYRKILTYCAKTGITVNTLVLYAWHKQLNIYSRSDVTVTGMTMSGRELAVSGIEESVGLYINTLPVIFDHKRQGKLLDELKELQNVINEVSSRSWHRLGKLGRGDKRIFNSLYVYENYPVAQWISGGLKIEFIKAAEKLDYPLGVIVNEREGSLLIDIKYAGELFDQDRIHALLEGMRYTIEQAAGDISLNIEQIRYIQDWEYEKLIYHWNSTRHEYPKDKTVIELFEAEVEKNPGSTAVVYEGVKLNYRELNEAANHLANYLVREYGVGSDQMITLCLERSELMIQAILGVMKAGGAYVPVLPEYPAQRIGYILRDTGTKIVITNKKYKKKLEESCIRNLNEDQRIIIEIIDDEDFKNKIANESRTNPGKRSCPDNLAYVIHTSGTTGEPKGVMIEQRSFINLVYSAHERFGLSENEVILFFTEYVFDMSVKQIFLALLHGHKLVVSHERSWMDGKQLIELMRREEVTFINTTPSLLRQLELDSVHSLRVVNAGGEAVTEELLNRMRGKHYTFLNAYGPTETTIVSHVNVGISGTHIGRPMWNTTSYILDETMRPVPLGAAGELYIGGIGVGRGYLNKPELTAEKFIVNPFQSEEEKKTGFNRRLYKTGDLARYLPDGNIDYLGRNDFQVKIQGFRIELGEIESALSGHGKVSQCAVLARSRAESKYLAAYYAGEAETSELREYLEEKLPEYMVPGAYVKLEALPLTVNGKLDTRALPEPDMQDTNEYEAPADETEKEMQALFAQVLEIEPEQLSVTGNFFRLGGNSIMAIKLANRIQRQMELDVKVADIFANKSVKKLSESVRQNRREKIRKTQFKRAEDQKLSYAQGRLWFIESYEGGSGAYNVPMSARLKEGVNAESVKKAVREIVKRHEVLRSVIRTDDAGEAYQETLDAELEIMEEQYRNKEEAEQAIQKETKYIFKLGEEIPIRVKLYTVGNDQYISVVLHHIAFDGWSQDIFVRELETLYRYYENGGIHAYPLEEIQIQYRDYAVWQREYLREVLDGQLEYWKKRLIGYETLNLPTDRERPARQLYEGDDVCFEFDLETSAAIHEYAKELGISVFTIMLGAYYLLLSVYSGQKDIVVGSVTANRNYEEISGTIGFFVNTLAMRQQLDWDKGIAEFLREVGTETADGERNGEVPFEQVVEALGAISDPSRHPVFQAMFSIWEEWIGGECLLEEIGGEQGGLYKAAKFDLHLSVAEGKERISGIFNYAVSLFERKTIERYMTCYIRIVSEIVKRKQKQLCDFALLDVNEYEQIINQRNRTESEYPRDLTAAELFEEQAVRTPDNTAVVYDGKRLSYRELNDAANRVANYLVKEYGIGADDIVALHLDRSEHMLINILGVLKAGAAYAPLRPDYPEERLDYMVRDTGTKVILANGQYEEKLKRQFPSLCIENIDGQKFCNKIKNESTDNPDRRCGPENLIYIMYTSGTTGEPKGVMTMQRGVVRLVKSCNYISITEKDVFLNLATYAFDGSTLDFFAPLLNGGSVVMPKEEEILDLKKIVEIINREGVTKFWITASLFNVLAEMDGFELQGVRTIIFGGEQGSMKHIRKFHKKHPAVQLINGYGPTETTTFAATKDMTGCEDELAVAIGKPISQTACYILDERMRPVPLGAIGELYIGGDGLARGYLNKPELTAEKFAANPFQSEEEKLRGYNARIYKTGDIVRYLDDGSIEFIGRNDLQVKIRGFRIELGDVENTLGEYPGVRQQAVLVNEREGVKYLAAYYAGEAETTQLRKYMENKLPEYMVPSVFMQLEQLPLNANGKLDKRALPSPETFSGEELYEAPADEQEAKLVKIFAEVLGLQTEKLSVNEDFFRLGGNSIMAIKLANRLQRELGLQVKVSDIFARKTVRRLSVNSNLGKLAWQDRPLIERRKFNRAEEQKLSYAQGRLWFIENYEGYSNTYNVPVTGKLREGISTEIIKQAIRELVKRHEALRSIIKIDSDGEGYQDVLDWNENMPEIGEDRYEDIAGLEAAIGRECAYVFKLGEEIPIRVKLFLLGEDRYLCVVAHHIAFDGWSLGILIKELSQLYKYYQEGGAMYDDTMYCEEYPLGEVRVQYRDYAAWQREYLRGDVLERQLTYWKKKLAGYETLNLLTDKERPSRVSYAGKEIPFEFTDETIEMIRELAKKMEVSVYSVMLSAYYLLLSVYSGQKDITVGTVNANREYEEISGTIGFFVNTIAMRQEVDTEGDVFALIKSVGESAREAQLHQDIPFEMLVNSLGINTSPDMHPIFQTMFVFQTPDESLLEISRAVFDHFTDDLHTFGYETAKFDLTLSIIDDGKKIRGNFNYALSLFEMETIESYIETYKEIISQIAMSGETNEIES